MIHQANGNHFRGEDGQVNGQCVCGRAFPLISTPREMSLVEHIAKENEAKEGKEGISYIRKPMKDE
jgi:hypothetical protein